MSSVDPTPSSLLSRLPACFPGGLLLTRPSSGAGATPMLPKNGFSGMTMPGANSAVIAFASIGMIRWPTERSQFSGRNPAQPL